MKACFKPTAIRLAVLVGLAIMGWCPSAHAALEILVSTSGPGGPFALPPGSVVGLNPSPLNTGPASFTGTLGNGITALLVASGSNSPGSGAFASLSGTQLQLTNTTGTSQTVWISIGAQGFTTPTTPPDILLQSGIGGSSLLGGTGTIAYQSFVDPANGQNSLVGFTEGLHSVAISGFFSTGGTTFIPTLTGTYSITQLIGVTLAGGASVSLGTSTSLTSVPEPSSMALAGLGALGLAAHGLRRRRVRGA